MLFIGPNDLASSMGYIAFDHASIPEVQEATKRILKAGLDAGKYVGHFALSPEIGKSHDLSDIDSAAKSSRADIR